MCKIVAFLVDELVWFGLVFLCKKTEGVIELLLLDGGENSLTNLFDVSLRKYHVR